jgi:outer membrane phospholipase A
MGDYVMLVYETHDSENPYIIHYTGDRQGAIDYAKEEHAFEVDIYKGMRIHPDAKSVCTVMYDGTILED